MKVLVQDAAHTATTVLYENPRKLTYNAGFKTTYDCKVNKQIYFNPNESVALGTASGVGIGTTIQFSIHNQDIQVQWCWSNSSLYSNKNNLD